MLGWERGIADFVLFRKAVLGASSCARLCLAEPPITLALFAIGDLNPILNIKNDPLEGESFFMFEHTSLDY